jgi:bla regulator protein blaR1
MISPGVSLLENHLWQSTLCVGVAWLLTLALRRNRAAVRYGIWFAASVKFLIPFSLLAGIGSRLGWRTVAASASPQWSTVIEDIGRPFAATAPTSAVGAAVATPVPHSIPSATAILFGIWACGLAVSAGFWIRNWRRARAVQQRATPLTVKLPIPAVSSETLLEPGVFGIFRPVLLLPEGITERLTASQFDAIVAHELCHVRRRDNLTAAVHTAVEALFWFHPLVWWMGGRLVEERERACDEEVLQSGSEPEAYAEGILSVCKFYTESPLACASGISGADLKSRIIRIMTEHASDRLSAGRKLLLGLVAAAAVAGPVAFGITDAPAVRAQSQSSAAGSAPLPSFEVASIKPNRSGSMNRFFRLADPSRFTVTNIPAKDLIEFAYHVQPFQVSGGPAWINSQGYDIEAKVDDSTVAELQKLPQEQRMDEYRLMLRSLLTDRFKLNLGHETKELPIYVLVVAKGGPKLTPTTIPQTPPADADAKGRPRGPMMMMAPGTLTAKDASTSSLAEILGRQPELGGRLVVDQTGLTGKYDFTLTFAPERMMAMPGASDGEGQPMRRPEGAPPPPDPNAPSIFTALQQQLGLKLESQKGPVQTLVIENIEKPSEN